MAGPWEEYQNPAGLAPSGLTPTPEIALTTPSGGKVFAKEALNTAALGYLPQIQGAISAATGGNYLQSRDEALRDLIQGRQEHPMSSTVGQLAGAGASALVPGMVLGKAYTAGGRIAQGAGVGALYGAASNPGDTIGQLNPIQAEDRLKNAAVGAGIGGAISGAIEGGTALTDSLGAKAAQLDPALAAKYPGMAQEAQDWYKLQKTNPVAAQSRIQGEIKKGAETLGYRGKELKDQIRNKVAGAQIEIDPTTMQGTSLEDPAQAAISRAYPLPDQTPPPRPTISGEDALGLVDTGYAANKYTNATNPIAIQAQKAQDAAATRGVRQALGEAVPEIEPLYAEAAENARYGKAANRYANNPAGILGTGLKARAVAQKLDEAGADISRLRDVNDISKTLAPEGLKADLVKGAGRAALRGGAAVRSTELPATSTLADFLLGKKATQATVDDSSTPPWEQFK